MARVAGTDAELSRQFRSVFAPHTDVIRDTKP